MSAQGNARRAPARWATVVGILLADLFLVNVALLVSVGLARNFRFPFGPVGFGVHFALPITAVASVLLVWRRLYRINSRFLGTVDLTNILAVGVLLGLVLRIVTFLTGSDPKVSNIWTAPVLFSMTSTALLAMCRLYQRIVAVRASLVSRTSRSRIRRLIVGAGDLGEALFRELARNDSSDTVVIGFVDDDPRFHGTTLNGVPVLGSLDQIRQLVNIHRINEILIALPGASEEELRRVFRTCVSTEARVRALPPLSRFVQGGSHVAPLLRDLNPDELLKRASLDPELHPVARYLNGERVLITGGGGSIGSELARQVSAMSPASLVLAGKGENSIFEIDQELRHAKLFHSTPVVCDIRDDDGLDRLFRTHRPTVVFHAAAHKHVPLMETVPIEAVRNNVFGTLRVAEAAMKYGSQKFILVSTDKAVNPSNVMGATKRVAEMIVSALANKCEVSFSAVRFGNVLGSRGSLIPILKKQIAAGGPVTLTHPEMTRFFMTIPEAVQLIVQAGALGEKGEIFILDMGDPVPIVELAKDLIRLHGLVPGEDIEIQFIGIRPGEKIHEELSHKAEDLVPSAYEKISTVRNDSAISWEWLKPQLDELERLCQAGDGQAVRTFLMELAWGKTMLPIGSVVAWTEEEAESEAARVNANPPTTDRTAPS